MSLVEVHQCQWMHPVLVCLFLMTHMPHACLVPVSKRQTHVPVLNKEEKRKVGMEKHTIGKWLQKI